MKITVERLVRSDIATVWTAWVTPEDVMQWNTASDDWHTTQCTIDLRVGGAFHSRMESKDGSMGFDFSGTFTKVVAKKLLEYSLADARTVTVEFLPDPIGVLIKETLDSEPSHTEEQQRHGWQSILNKFAHYVEAKSK